MRILKGLGSLITLVVMLVGVPFALIHLAGNPIPSLQSLQDLFLLPGLAGPLLVESVLPIIGWIAWATFAFGILSVIPAMIRNVEPPQLPGLSIQQKTGKALIGSIIAMVTVFGAPGAFAAETPQIDAGTQISQTISHTEASKSSVEAAEESKQELPTVVVKNGDSLWSIAEQRLGDGNRFPEIAKLNYGVKQHDGSSLSKDHYIHAGWKLSLPADAAPSKDVEHKVKDGETFSSIAKDLYQDFDKADDIYNASASIVQFDGRQLGDGAALKAGYRVIAPDAQKVSAPVAKEVSKPKSVEKEKPAPTPTNAAPAPTPEAAPKAETPAPVADSSPDVVISDQAPSQSEESSSGLQLPAPTVWGAAGILAAGVIGLLKVKRGRQERRRKPGERIPAMTTEAHLVESELAAAADLASVDDVDRALHFLASWAMDKGLGLPQLFAVRLSASSIEVYLDQPMALPLPFVAGHNDQTVWTLNPADLPEFERQTSAPYPGLVSLGRDDNDGHLLIDLEQTRALNVAGDDATAKAVLTALAVELASSRWSEELLVSLVGFAPELPEAFNTGRCRYFNTAEDLIADLEARAERLAEDLETEGYESTKDARVAHPHAESWPPEIILLDTPPQKDTAVRLAQVVEKTPRVGIAAITQGHLTGDWALEVNGDGRAVLSPTGIEFAAQVVTEEKYQHILTALGIAEQAPVQAKPVEVPAPEKPAVSAVETESPIKLKDHAKNIAEEEVTVTLPSAPFIRVLGAVAIENPCGNLPASSKGSMATTREIITYLALHPNANTEQYDAALHFNQRVTSNNRNPKISNARKFLGTSPEGEQYLLPYNKEQGYRLHPDVRTDWSIFQELVGSDPFNASTGRLKAALDLVRDVPLSSGIRADHNTGEWLEKDMNEMRAAISDVAYELGERALEEQDYELLIQAGVIGIQVSPRSEAHRRHKLIGYAKQFDEKSFKRTVEEIYEQISALEEDGPDPETANVIAQYSQVLQRAKAS